MLGRIGAESFRNGISAAADVVSVHLVFHGSVFKALPVNTGFRPHHGA